MSDPQALHAALVDWLDDWERDVPQPEPMLAAMRAVVELHKPVRTAIDPYDNGHLVVDECSECGGGKWPCQTVKVISSALGVTTDG